MARKHVHTVKGGIRTVKAKYIDRTYRKNKHNAKADGGRNAHVRLSLYTRKGGKR